MTEHRKADAHRAAGARIRAALRSRVVLGGLLGALAVIGVSVALIPGGKPAAAPAKQVTTPARTARPAAKPAPKPAPKPALSGWSTIATLDGAVARYARPGGSPDGTIAASWYGRPSALPVIGSKPGWLRVRLATRPNGSTAWIRHAHVSISQTPYRIVLNVVTKHLELLLANHVVMDAPAGIGTSDDPTPLGQFFVAFYEQAPSAGYGPFIIVTSAHSESISDWEGSGDAVIGIHGPLGAYIGPDGAAVSHGCIRLPDVDLTRLSELQAGTPITVER